MTKETVVSMSFGSTTNLGNFESIRVDASLERQLKPGETTEQAYKEIFAEIYKEVTRKSHAVKKKHLAVDED
jgi:hypothetical protein